MAQDYTISIKALDEASAAIKKINDSLKDLKKAQDQSNQSSENDDRRVRGRFASVLNGIKILGKSSAAELEAITKQFSKLGMGIGEVVGGLEGAWKLGGIAGGIAAALALGKAFKTAADNSRELAQQVASVATPMGELERIKSTLAAGYGVSRSDTFSAIKHVEMFAREAQTTDPDKARFLEGIPQLRGKWMGMNGGEIAEKILEAERDAKVHPERYASFQPKQGQSYEAARNERLNYVFGSESMLLPANASQKDYDEQVAAAKKRAVEDDDTNRIWNEAVRKFNTGVEDFRSVMTQLKKALNPLVKWGIENPGQALGVGALVGLGGGIITAKLLQAVLVNTISKAISKAIPTVEVLAAAVETELEAAGFVSIILNGLKIALRRLVLGGTFLSFLLDPKPANENEPNNFKGSPLDVSKLTPEQAQQVLDTGTGLSDQQKGDLKIRAKGGAVAPIPGANSTNPAVGGPGFSSDLDSHRYYTGEAPAHEAEHGGFNFAGIRGEKGFRTYPDEYSGVADTARLLRVYKQKGDDTIEKIFNAWAPASDNNNTELLIKRAAEWTGFKRDQAIDVNDPATMEKMLQVMHRNEFGGQTFNPNTLSGYVKKYFGETSGSAGVGGNLAESMEKLQIVGKQFHNDCARVVNAATKASGLPPITDEQGNPSLIATNAARWGRGVGSNEAQIGDMFVAMNRHGVGERGGHVGIVEGVKHEGGHTQVKVLSTNTEDEEGNVVGTGGYRWRDLDDQDTFLRRALPLPGKKKEEEDATGRQSANDDDPSHVHVHFHNPPPGTRITGKDGSTKLTLRTNYSMSMPV